jgi:hypothetical protein
MTYTAQQFNGTNSRKGKFFQFFRRLAFEKEFQLERTRLPLAKIVLVVDPNPKGDFVDKIISVEKSEWKHEYFYYSSDRRYRPQIFDNFEAKLGDTDERVFAWLSIEVGFQIYYYLRRIDVKWYLVKIRDLSIL